MMMVGYALDYPSGTYGFYKPSTNNIIVSNSVKWNDFSRWKVSGSDGPIGQLLQEKSEVNESESDSDDDVFSDSALFKKVRFSQDTNSQCGVNFGNSNNGDDEHFGDEESSTLDTNAGAIVSVGSSGSTDVQVSKGKVAKFQRALKKLSTSPSYKVTGNVVPHNAFEREDKHMGEPVDIDEYRSLVGK